MGKATMYSIFNDGTIKSLACGYRSVIALPPGRKFIVLVDWTTLETAKLDLASWARMKPAPQEVPPKRARAIRKAMKARAAYITPTNAAKEAMKNL